MNLCNEKDKTISNLQKVIETRSIDQMSNLNSVKNSFVNDNLPVVAMSSSLNSILGSSRQSFSSPSKNKPVPVSRLNKNNVAM